MNPVEPNLPWRLTKFGLWNYHDVCKEIKVKKSVRGLTVEGFYQMAGWGNNWNNGGGWNGGGGGGFGCGIIIIYVIHVKQLFVSLRSSETTQNR